MGNWFGDLQLAYKYTIVFVSLLVIVLLAGFIKVFFVRRKLKKLVKQQEAAAEAGQSDQVELNQREKDEGDLFGVRAIEAGFYAGIPQSRPTSRAGSYIDSPATSSHTLVGKASSLLKAQGYSMNNSVASLPLAHTNNGSRDSETLGSNSPPRRNAPPAIRLAPSEAEISGRHNHNAAVNMSLNVPPSPVLAKHPQSPTFGGSDSGDSDGRSSPYGQNNSRLDHYAPAPPHIPMPDGLRATVHSGEEHRSQAASFNNPSPDNSTPPSPGHPPESKLPSLPAKALRDEPRSLSPGAGSKQPKPEFERPSSPVRLQPQAYQPQPTHQRDASDASSVYSNANRLSTWQQQRMSTIDYSLNNTASSNADQYDGGLSASSAEDSRRPNSSLNVPGKPHDPRLSEFYDAYYRQSQLGLPSKDGKRPNQLDLAQDTIAEVESPLPSPNPHAPLMQHPGTAM